MWSARDRGGTKGTRHLLCLGCATPRPSPWPVGRQAESHLPAGPQPPVLCPLLQGTGQRPFSLATSSRQRQPLAGPVPTDEGTGTAGAHRASAGAVVAPLQLPSKPPAVPTATAQRSGGRCCARQSRGLRRGAETGSVVPPVPRCAGSWGRESGAPGETEELRFSLPLRERGHLAGGAGWLWLETPTCLFPPGPFGFGVFLLLYFLK